MSGRIAPSPSNEGAWEIPFEIAIACSNSVFVGVVRERAKRGIFPVGPARVSAHGQHLFAVVPYAESDVGFQLDVQLQARGE